LMTARRLRMLAGRMGLWKMPSIRMELARMILGSRSAAKTDFTNGTEIKAATVMHKAVH
jgi:hypothetical protein